jgi:Flp pilus assembly protein TadG
MMFRNVASAVILQRRGTVSALIALTLPVIIGVTAVGLDGGLMYLQRRQAQSAADSAALAGAYALYGGATFSAAQTAAATIGSENGITISTSQVTQPTSSTVAVSVTSTKPKAFSAIWGAGNMSATATATATWGASSSSVTPYSTYAVVLLNTVTPTMSQSLYLTGSAVLTANAGIQVNSTSSTAVWADNSGQSPSPINVAGNYHQEISGELTGSIKTGAAVISDPLASMSTPSVPSTTGGYYSISGVSPTGVSPYPGWGNWGMKPGVYTSDPNPRGGSTITMLPGLYYFQGCGFTINNGSTVSGSGVTIYIDNGGGAFSIAGGCPVTLSAASSSTAVNNAIPGVVYFQSRSSTVPVTFNNGTNINLTGTFYAAKAQLVFAGGTLTQFSSQVVCDNMNLSNHALITVPYSSSTVAGSAAYSYPVALTK